MTTPMRARTASGKRVGGANKVELKEVTAVAPLAQLWLCREMKSGVEPASEPMRKNIQRP